MTVGMPAPSRRTTIIGILVLVPICLALYASFDRRTSTLDWSNLSLSGKAASRTLQWSQEADDDFAEFENRPYKVWKHEQPVPPSRWSPDPSTPTPVADYTACILWLTQRSKLWETSASMELVLAHTPMTRPYTIVLLHDGDLTSPSLHDKWRDRWLARATQNRREGRGELADKMEYYARPGMVQFAPLDLDAPMDIARLGLSGLGEVVWDFRWPGYHSMCRFFSALVFTHPVIGQFDYYMRMDTDSFLLSSFSTDPFLYMHTHALSYAWRGDGTDPEFVVDGLREFIDQWLVDHPDLAPTIRANMAHDRGVAESEPGGRFPMYDTNWEIVHVPAFRTGQTGVDEWIGSLLDHPKGFYQKRWGDAPLRRATTAMFMSPDKVRQFCAFAYRHGGNLFQPNPECEI